MLSGKELGVNNPTALSSCPLNPPPRASNWQNLTWEACQQDRLLMMSTQVSLLKPRTLKDRFGRTNRKQPLSELLRFSQIRKLLKLTLNMLQAQPTFVQLEGAELCTYRACMWIISWEKSWLACKSFSYGDRVDFHHAKLQLGFVNFKSLSPHTRKTIWSKSKDFLSRWEEPDCKPTMSESVRTHWPQFGVTWLIIAETNFIVGTIFCVLQFHRAL